MNKVIKIEDYPCGSGKTTRMIEGFKPARNWTDLARHGTVT